jgi:hypothetical protein
MPEPAQKAATEAAYRGAHKHRRESARGVERARGRYTYFLLNKLVRAKRWAISSKDRLVASRNVGPEDS